MKSPIILDRLGNCGEICMTRKENIARMNLELFRKITFQIVVDFQPFNER